LDSRGSNTDQPRAREDAGAMFSPLDIEPRKEDPTLTMKRNAPRVLVSVLIIVTIVLSMSARTGLSSSTIPLVPAIGSHQMQNTSQPLEHQNDAPIAQFNGGSNRKILYLSNVTTSLSTAEQMAEAVGVDTIRSTTSFLASFDNRYTGTKGNIQSISYISNYLERNCSIKTVFFDNFSFNDQGVIIKASNIIAKVSATNYTDKTILVTAHYDSIGYQYPFNIYSAGAKGCDDDATGVSALLETARIISCFKEHLKYNVVFVVFAAEEGNKTLDPDFMCQGSNQWISTGHSGVTAIGDIISAINLDEVGYKNAAEIGIYHYSSGLNVANNLSWVASELNMSAHDEGAPRQDSYFDYIRCRTEQAFDSAGIQGVTLSNHNPNPFIHSTFDTVSYIDFNLVGNFTKLVVSYISLTGCILSDPDVTYATTWSTIIDANGQFDLVQSNYISVYFNPSIVNEFDLIVIDPSMGKTALDHLLWTIATYGIQGREIPIVSLGEAVPAFVRTLNLTDVEYLEQDSSHDNLTAHIGNSITDLCSHPVYNSPNRVRLSIENSTYFCYAVLREQSRNCSYYLIGNNASTSRHLLMLSCTPYLSRLWGWLAVLHDYSSNCGPLALIGINNGSRLTDVARDIVENTIHWLINNTKTVTAVRPSSYQPLVGDHISFSIAVKDSLTWEANSSILISIEVTAPSGRPMLGETYVTGGDGVAVSNTMLVSEIGDYAVTVNTHLGAGAISRCTSTFSSMPRITILCTNNCFNVTQGEPIRIALSLYYKPIQPEDQYLELSGKPLISNESVAKVLAHGYNNITLTINTREAILPGRYNLIVSTEPITMEYISGSQLIDILISPAYEVSIIEAPETIGQFSSAELLVQVKSYRSISVDCSLRITSHNIILAGEISFTISSGETRQLNLTVGDGSLSPYAWGDSEIRVSVIRNGVPVAESQPTTIHVSVSPVSIILGYCMPMVIPIVVLVERSRKTKPKPVATGIFLGGYTFFACGLMICQSLFLIVPLSMQLAGCYIGALLTKRIFDMPLPRGYDWSTPPQA
jgi:hypothetical protein